MKEVFFMDEKLTKKEYCEIFKSKILDSKEERKEICTSVLLRLWKKAGVKTEDEMIQEINDIDMALDELDRFYRFGGNLNLTDKQKDRLIEIFYFWIFATLNNAVKE